MKNFKTIRAIKLFALFIFIMNKSILFSSSLLPNINNNSIFVDYDILSDSSKIDSLFLFSNNNNINKIFLKFIDNGQSIYDSELIPKIDSLNYISDDLINDFIYRSEILGLDVYAWIDMYKIWSKDYYPNQFNHFYNVCPDCLESDINGRSDKNIKLDQIQSKEWEGVFISPLNDNSNSYLLSLIFELMNNFDLDGIIMDYLRYQDYYYGYNKEGVNHFTNEYNINPLDINREFILRKYGFNKSEIDSVKKIWDDYKAQKITDLLINIKNKSIENSLYFDVGVSVKPNPVLAKSRWSQDWEFWINNNLVDYVVVENYTHDFYDFNFNNYNILKYINDDKINNIYMGILIKNDKIDNILDQILSLRLKGYTNISLKKYDFDLDTLGSYLEIYKIINLKISD